LIFFLEIYKDIILVINLVKLVIFFLILLGFLIYSSDLLIINNIILIKISNINKKNIIIYILISKALIKSLLFNLYLIF
jgi:hypothetical protein